MHTCVGWGPWGQSRGPVAFTWIQTTPLLQAKSVLLGAEPAAADLDSGRMLEHRTPAHTQMVTEDWRDQPSLPTAGAGPSNREACHLSPGLPHAVARLPAARPHFNDTDCLCTNALRIFKSAIDFQTANKNVFIRRGSP